jgi:hypothetical protein
MGTTEGHLPPLPVDAQSLHDELHISFDREGVDGDAAATALAMTSQGCSLASHDPVAMAAAIATAWTSLNRWRGCDPRSSARIVTMDASDAAVLRSRGLDAITAFAQSGTTAGDGMGLIVAVDANRFDRRGLIGVLGGPDHVRIVLLDRPSPPGAS